MTVRELTALLLEVDPDLRVGGSGWFGEYLPVEYTHVTEDQYDTRNGTLLEPSFFNIHIQNPGEEPD